jgi:hypothetical protein
MIIRRNSIALRVILLIASPVSWLPPLVSLYVLPVCVDKNTWDFVRVVRVRIVPSTRRPKIRV